MIKTNYKTFQKQVGEMTELEAEIEYFHRAREDYQKELIRNMNANGGKLCRYPTINREVINNLNAVLGMYLETLNKKTPLKPEKISKTSPGNSKCPNCEKEGVMEWIHRSNNFCSRCGQALDWSEE